MKRWPLIWELEYLQERVEGKTMDRPSCGMCKHFKDVGYQNWGECTAQVPCWAWGEYIETTRLVFRDGSTADLAPDCEAYTPKPNVARVSSGATADRLRSDDAQSAQPALLDGAAPDGNAGPRPRHTGRALRPASKGVTVAPTPGGA